MVGMCSRGLRPSVCFEGPPPQSILGTSCFYWGCCALDASPAPLCSVRRGLLSLLSPRRLLCRILWCQSGWSSRSCTRSMLRMTTSTNRRSRWDPGQRGRREPVSARFLSGLMSERVGCWAGIHLLSLVPDVCSLWTETSIPVRLALSSCLLDRSFSVSEPWVSSSVK